MRSYKKGHKYLTVACDHITGRVIWAAKGRSKDTVDEFFDISTWLTAIIGAIILLFIYRLVVGRGRRRAL